MLDIFLQILSITGWCLLGILALVLLLLILLLVCPVSYRLKWSCSDFRKHTARFKAFWLLGILTVRYSYPVPGAVTARLFGIKVYDFAKESKESSGKNDKSVKKQKDKSQRERQNDHDVTDFFDQEKEAASVHDKNTSGSQTTKNTKLCFKDKIRSIFRNILNKIRTLIAKFKNGVSTVAYYWELIREEETGLLFDHIFTRTGNILRCIRPRKLKGSILIGTGSPDTTGLCMGLYGMLSPHLGKNLVITPDFEEKVLRGQLTIKGRMTGYVILYNALKVAIDKKLHSFSKKFKREV